LNSSIAEDRAVEIARKALQAGDKVFARQMLAKLLTSNPKLTSAWVLMAQTVDLEAQKLDCWRRVLALEPDHPEALQALGLAIVPESTVAPLPSLTKDVNPPHNRTDLPIETSPLSQQHPLESASSEKPQNSAAKDASRRVSPPLTKEEARRRIRTATLPPRWGTVLLILLGFLLLTSLGIFVGGSIWFFRNLPVYQPFLSAGQIAQFAIQMAFPLGLMVVGFIGTIITSLGLYNTVAGQQEAWRLNSSDNVVDATVVDAWIETPEETESRITSYWVAYQFEMGLLHGGVERFTIKERISEPVFIRLEIGARVPVRFLIENPRICRLNFKTF